MRPNENLRQTIFSIIDNQIRNNDPPETSQTFTRLKQEGFSDFEAKQLIGQCLSVEIFDSMKNEMLSDQDRYIENLRNLPKEPV